MKPDVKKIIADIKATKGNRKFCNGLAGTLQDDNYASSICKYVKTVTPERIDLLIEYAEKLEAEVTDMAVQLANAESKCRELAAENAGLKSFGDKLNEMHNDLNGEGTGIQGRAEVACQQVALEAAMEEFDAIKTPATDAFLAEVRAQGVDEFLRGSQLPYQIATVLADYDNVDDATLQTVIWSGQPPEPDGDVWHLEYVSRGNAIVRAVLKELRKGVQS
ncbi:hypothetical protein IDE71_003619 [Escherichia coli]|nr:hypothetical protein [Escherichia coli]EFH9370610.1 hypothetical protein [Escherichia coli]EGG1130814.1 hypothetical protein [Escherichia coli]EHC2023532.1 hypothetical protein [Escherichia coli]MHQ02278.1 hypothetical protein [Escherichia coli]